MGRKKHVVNLSDEERSELETFISTLSLTEFYSSFAL